MNIDVAALRGLVREKDVSFDTVVEAIESALLAAYYRTDGAHERARAQLDRKTGEVTVWALEVDDQGEVTSETDDTPSDFGRIAAMTAKQVIMSRLRDVAQETTYGEYAGREGDLVSGLVQHHSGVRPEGPVFVHLGDIEGVLPHSEQVPGERYVHGDRLRCLVISVHKGPRGAQVTLSRSHPNLVRKLFAMEVPEIADGTVEIAAIAREPGHRTKVAVRSTSAEVRARGAPECEPSSPSCTGRRSTSSTGIRTRPPSLATRFPRPRSTASRWSMRPPRRPASWFPTSSSPSRSARKVRTLGSPTASLAGESTSMRTLKSTRRARLLRDEERRAGPYLCRVPGPRRQVTVVARRRGRGSAAS
jgi:hypothetical protein